MKKNGFTLAEVLITLAIVGVVAALTLPTLTNNTVTAQIGPKLSKAVSAFEQANQALLQEFTVDSLNQTGLLVFNGNDAGTLNNYITALGNHFKITRITEAVEEPTNIGNPDTCKVNRFPSVGQPAANGQGAVEIPGSGFTTKDGIAYILVMSGKLEEDPEGAESWSVSNNLVGAGPHNQQLGNVYVDINGTNNGPNEYGTDAFVFEWYNDGSLRPVGSGSASASECTWREHCNVDAAPTDARACAGHVFENNLKVRYN